jgi:hypothetical protein
MRAGWLTDPEGTPYPPESWHLGGELSPGDGGADRVYWFAVILRLATQAYVVVLVVRDVLRPSRDAVRAQGTDDPTGGVLDGAPDAPWRARLRLPA